MADRDGAFEVRLTSRTKEDEHLKRCSGRRCGPSSPRSRPARGSRGRLRNRVFSGYADRGRGAHGCRSASPCLPETLVRACVRAAHVLPRGRFVRVRARPETIGGRREGPLDLGHGSAAASIGRHVRACTPSVSSGAARSARRNLGAKRRCWTVPGPDNAIDWPSTFSAQLGSA